MNKKPDHKMLISALHYAKQYNFSVFPCNGKKPLIKWAPYQKEKATDTKIKEWWDRWPEANVAVVTGKISGNRGLCVVDIDTTEGMKEIAKYIPFDLDVPTSHTPSGGKHLFFEMPETTLTNNSRIIPGADLRAEGGYIIMPPSTNDKGQYKWDQTMSIRQIDIPQLPKAYLDHVKSSNPLKQQMATQPNLGQQFLKDGSRDSGLFHTANSLLKGGMSEQNARQVIEILAQNCNPPFPVSEANAKVASAMTRQHRQHQNLTQMIRDFVVQQQGNITSTFIQQSLTLNHIEKRNLSTIMKRLCDEGIVERCSKQAGTFRKVETFADKIDFMNAPTSTLDVQFPLNLGKHFRCFGKNLILIAGSPDSGKTAWMLNFARLNMGRHKINYFSSEMGAVELRDRISGFEMPLKEWKQCNFVERASNFTDIIRPDEINLIDYLECHDEFWRIGGWLKGIFDKLNNGIAVVAIQKKKGGDARGGLGALEKPRLILNMESGVASINKCKNWVSHINPNGMQLFYKLYQGCQFIIDKEWHRPHEDGNRF